MKLNGLGCRIRAWGPFGILGVWVWGLGLRVLYDPNFALLAPDSETSKLTPPSPQALTQALLPTLNPKP